MSVETHQLVGTPITSHSFNRDASKLAIANNSNIVQLYQRNSMGFSLDTLLQEHDKLVTCVDWAPETNRIVTCSQDRNAYVWTWDGQTNTWKPTLVLLRINRYLVIKLKSRHPCTMVTKRR
jgi:actin related protein 2/3 complex subunit 1A/1B